MCNLLYIVSMILMSENSFILSNRFLPHIQFPSHSSRKVVTIVAAEKCFLRKSTVKGRRDRQKSLVELFHTLSHALRLLPAI